MTSEGLATQVAQYFTGPDQQEVVALLRTYGQAPHEREVDRVRRVILSLCQGSVARVAQLVALAKVDYRDILVREGGPPAP